MVNASFKVKVDIEDSNPNEKEAKKQIEGLAMKCHEVVSALVCAYKYQRTKELQQLISTNVNSAAPTIIDL